MIRPGKHVGWVALGGLAVWLSYGAAAVAIDHSIRPYTEYDRCGPCVPNISGFGYYRTTWRQWPGEPRPDQTFPQSLGAEAVPAPAPGRRQPEVLPTPDRIPSQDMPAEPPPPSGETETPDEPSIQTPSPAEPMVTQPSLPSFEEPAEPNPFPETLPPAMPDEPSFDPSPLAPEPFQSPTPGPLEPEPATPAPLDPTGEDPLPGLRSMVPVEPEGDGDAAPMPGEMLSAPRLASAGMLAPLPGEDLQLPTPPNQPGTTSNDGATDQASNAWSAAQRDIEPIEKSTQTPPVRADWVSARNPGFHGDPVDAGEPAAANGDVAAADGNLPSLEPAPGPPRTLPTEVPADELPTTVAPLKPDAEGPELIGLADVGVRSTSADVPEQPVTVAPSPPEWPEQPESPEPSGGRPVALDGFCLYELSANERWIEGDPKWSAVHQGRTYLFSSQQHRDRFLANPDRYAPAYAGYDPVLVVEGNRFIPGKTDFCLNYGGRLYALSSAVTLARFQRDPTRYATGR